MEGSRMDNLLLGLHNIWMNTLTSLSRLLHEQLVWGFVLGFVASTMIHLFIMSAHANRSAAPSKYRRAKLIVFGIIILLFVVSAAAFFLT